MENKTGNGTQVQKAQSSSQPTASALDLGAVRKKLQELERTLNALVPGHPEMIRGLVLGLAAGEHVAVIGPPGIAKSYAIRALSQLIGAKFYSYLMTKFTTYDELFGPVDVAELARGNFKRRYSDIVVADVVFLDEVFKANSAVLNALLSLMQERVVYDPMSGVAVQANLHVLIGASNEAPADEELAALFDRFAVKVYEGYLQDDAALLKALEARWAGNGAPSTAVVSMQEVRQVSEYVRAVLLARVAELNNEALYRIYAVNAIPLVKTLRQRGVLVSDRYAVEKLPKLYAAYLVLYGPTPENVVGAVYELIQYTARSRQELADIRKFLDEAMGEVGELAKRLEEAKAQVRGGDLRGAKEKLMSVVNFDLSKIEKTPWMKPRVEAIISSAREYLRQIESIEKTLKSLAGEE
ncbi:MAG: AAA family ATPase [Thermoproteus sp.]